MRYKRRYKNIKEIYKNKVYKCIGEAIYIQPPEASNELNTPGTDLINTRIKASYKIILIIKK